MDLFSLLNLEARIIDPICLFSLEENVSLENYFSYVLFWFDKGGKEVLIICKQFPPKMEGSVHPLHLHLPKKFSIKLNKEYQLSFTFSVGE